MIWMNFVRILAIKTIEFYSMRKDTNEVTDSHVGKRTNKILRQVVNTLLLSAAKKIFYR